MTEMVVDRHQEKLKELAQRIAGGHRHFEMTMRKSLVYAATAGRALQEAKQLVAYGHWLKWVEQNTNLGAREQQRYTRVADVLPGLLGLPADCTTDQLTEKLIGCDLSLTEVLALAADKREPEGDESDTLTVEPSAITETTEPMDEIPLPADEDVPDEIPYTPEEAGSYLDDESVVEPVEDNADVSPEATVVSQEQSKAEDATAEDATAEQPVVSQANPASQEQSEAPATTPAAATSSNQQQTAAATPAPATTEPLKDALGVVVPEALWPVFALCEGLRSAGARQNMNTAFLKTCEPLQYLHLKTLIHDSQMVFQNIKNLLPYAVCPCCRGSGLVGKASCRACSLDRVESSTAKMSRHGNGWLDKRNYENWMKLNGQSAPRS